MQSNVRISISLGYRAQPCTFICFCKFDVPGISAPCHSWLWETMHGTCSSSTLAYYLSTHNGTAHTRYWMLCCEQCCKSKWCVKKGPCIILIHSYLHGETHHTYPCLFNSTHMGSSVNQSHILWAFFFLLFFLVSASGESLPLKQKDVCNVSIQCIHFTSQI